MKTSAVCVLATQSSQRVLSAVGGSIIAVCGTLWYVPRNAQSSPGGRRRQCRFNIVELTRWKFCAQEAKLPPWEAASLSEVRVQAAPLSSPIEVTLHLYAAASPSARACLSTDTYQKGLVATILVPHSAKNMYDDNM